MADLDTPHVIPLTVEAECWRCQLVFHLAIPGLKQIPLDSLLRVKCPHECAVDNIFRRVPAPDFIVPGDSYDSQASAYWGRLGGPNLN